MRCFSAPLALACLCLVLLPAAAPAAVHTFAKGPGLIALGQTLPAARSGQTYLWTLKVEGGKPPYRCVAKKLDLGTLALTTACRITGRAPVVRSTAVTGPFRFKVQDSSSPKKTAEFPSMNFTILGPPTPAAPPAPVVPPVPADFQVAESGQTSDGSEAIADVFIKNPASIDVRFTGSKFDDIFTEVGCSMAGKAFPLQETHYKTAGLYTVSVPAGADYCEVIAAASATGAITAQVLANGGTFTPGPLTTAPATPTPTTPTPPKGSPSDPSGTYRGTWNAVVTQSGCTNIAATGAATFVVTRNPNNAANYDYTESLKNFSLGLEAPACKPNPLDVNGAGFLATNFPGHVGTWTDPDGRITVKDGVLTGSWSFPSPNGIALGETVSIRATRG